MGEGETLTAPTATDWVGRQKERSRIRKTYKGNFHRAFVSRVINSPSAMEKLKQKPVIEVGEEDGAIKLPENLQFLGNEAVRVALTLHEVAIKVEPSTNWFFDLNKFNYYQTDQPLFPTINSGNPIDTADLGQPSQLTPNIMQGLISLLQLVNTRKHARIIIPGLQD